jgi:hypothetical protein
LPGGVAFDGAGNLYVTDAGNQNIRKIAPGGVVTALAGAVGNAGNVDGTGAAAQFNFPIGLATDSLGNVYVADTQDQAIRRIMPGGVVTTLAGSARRNGVAGGTDPAAVFRGPRGMAMDGAGNSHVADTFAIRKITPAVAGAAADRATRSGAMHTPTGRRAGLRRTAPPADPSGHTIPLRCV